MTNLAHEALAHSWQRAWSQLGLHAPDGLFERLLTAYNEPHRRYHTQQLLVDIDLAILGTAPARFSEYDRQVREEYSWVPGLLYRIKRKAVLKHFLSRERLYNTDHFQERYEDQARINLKTAIG